MDRFRNTGQPDWDWWGRVWPTPGATLRRLGLALGDRVVEVGSGNGYFALLANAFHGIEDRAAFVEAVAAAGRFVVVNWRDLPREETTIGGEPRGSPTDLRLPPEATRRAVEGASELRLAREVDLPPYYYGLVFER